MVDLNLNIFYSKHTFLLPRQDGIFVVNQATGKELIFNIDSYDILEEIKPHSRLLKDIYKDICNKYLPQYHDFILRDLEEIINQLHLEGFIVISDVYETENIDSHTKSIFKEFVPKLTNLTIELTNRCNEHCIHCYLGENKFKKSSDLSLQKARDIIDQFVGLGGKAVTFTGGEILIYPYLREILEYANANGLEISLFSNLISLTQEHIDLFKRLNIVDIQTSLYSYIPIVHDKITKVCGSCEKTIRSIRKLREVDLSVRISCPLMNANRKDIIGLIDFCKKNSLDLNIDVAIQGQYDGNLDNLSQRLTLQEIYETLSMIKKYDKEFGNKYLRRHCKTKNLKPIEFINLPICSAGHDNLYINSQGEVSACPTLQGYVVGNIMDEDLKTIWISNKKLLEIRNATQTSFPGCLNCDSIDFCGRCFAVNFIENKDLWKVPKYRCKLAKIQKEISEIF